MIASTAESNMAAADKINYDIFAFRNGMMKIKIPRSNIIMFLLPYIKDRPTQFFA